MTQWVNRRLPGFAMAGALALAVVLPAGGAAAAAGSRDPGLGLSVDRLDDPKGVQWIRTGDVLRFRIRLEGTARSARLSVAASPAGALSSVSCPERRARVTSGAPRQEAGGASAGVRQASDGASVCLLGDVSGARSVDVRLVVPDGAERVVLAAVAQRLAASGETVETVRATATTVVGKPPSSDPSEAQPVSPLKAPAVTEAARPSEDQAVSGGRAEPRDTADRSEPRTRSGDSDPAHTRPDSNRGDRGDLPVDRGGQGDRGASRGDEPGERASSDKDVPGERAGSGERVVRGREGRRGGRAADRDDRRGSDRHHRWEPDGDGRWAARGERGAGDGPGSRNRPHGEGPRLSAMPAGDAPAWSGREDGRSAVDPRAFERPAADGPGTSWAGPQGLDSQGLAAEGGMPPGAAAGGAGSSRADGVLAQDGRFAQDGQLAQDPLFAQDPLLAQGGTGGVPGVAGPAKGAWPFHNGGRADGEGPVGEGGLWGEPGLRLPKAAPLAVDVLPAPVAAGAPLPREVAVSGRKAAAETPVEGFEGARGLPLTGGGIAVLLAGLWGISRAQSRRSTRQS